MIEGGGVSTDSERELPVHFGLPPALGATSGHLFRWSLRLTLAPMLWGGGAAPTGEVWAGGWLKSELVGVTAQDPGVLGGRSCPDGFGGEIGWAIAGGATG